MVYEAGTTTTSSSGTITGVGVTGQSSAIGVAATEESSVHQTALAARLSPPKKKEVDGSILGCGIPIAIVIAFIIINIAAPKSEFGNFVAFIFLFAAIVVPIIIYCITADEVKMHNIKMQSEFEQWNRKWICLTCGNEFILQEDNALPQAVIAPTSNTGSAMESGRCENAPKTEIQPEVNQAERKSDNGDYSIVSAIIAGGISASMALWLLGGFTYRYTVTEIIKGWFSDSTQEHTFETTNWNGITLSIVVGCGLGFLTWRLFRIEQKQTGTPDAAKPIENNTNITSEPTNPISGT